MDADGILLGRVSRSDALPWRVSRTPDQATLAKVLSDASQPHGTPQEPISRIADVMVDTGLGRIPIVEPSSGRVIGILTRHDLLKFAICIAPLKWCAAAEFKPRSNPVAAIPKEMRRRTGEGRTLPVN